MTDLLKEDCNTREKPKDVQSFTIELLPFSIGLLILIFEEVSPAPEVGGGSATQ